jgi:ArsR family transcriptional regulator
MIGQILETTQIGAMSEQEAEHFASLFKAISHPVRVKMLDIIQRAEGEICVCHIEESFDLTQPTISHHLKILRDVGLIESEQRGLWVYHRIRPEIFATMRHFLEGFR